MGAGAYSGLIQRRRIAFILAPLILVAVLMTGLPRLSVSTDFDIYFSDENPQLADFRRFERVFTAQENLSFLILPADGDVLDRRILELVHELSTAAWSLPHARRVSSLTNHPYTTAEADLLRTEELVPDPSALDESAIRELRRIIPGQHGLWGNLVARDFSATSVNVTLSLPDDAARGNEETVAAARALRDRLMADRDAVRVLIGGSSATNVTLTEAVERDVVLLVTLSYAVILLGLLILLRSLIGTLVTLAVISLSILGTLGLFGWLGYVISPVTGFVPSVIMTIAVADSVHLLVTWFHERRDGATPLAAMRESLRLNAQPIFLTSLTTAIGVLSLNFSDSPPYRDLGNMIAVGVTLAWILSMSLMPAVLLSFPGRGSQLQIRGQAQIQALAGWVIRYRRRLLPVMAVVVLVLAAFIARNQLTERWHRYFDDSFEIRQAIDEADDRMGAVHAIQYMLDSGEASGINDPQYLGQVAAFAAWLRAQPSVSYVSAISDTVCELNRLMHGDDPDFERVPETRELAAQYLLLYELSLPRGAGMDSSIDVDRSATRLSVLLERSDSEALLRLDRRAQAWLASNAPAIEPAAGTGLDMIFAHINHRNIRSILQGTALALVLISGLLIFALRSFRLGLISLVPNLAPALMAYGIWGLLQGHIDLALSIVSAMSLGIVVDDTVHFMTKYRRAVADKALDATEAIRYAFRTVGVALVITTLVLVTGFSVLAFSGFNPTRETGTLLALVLGIALVVDFLLLPPLLIATSRPVERGEEDHKGHEGTKDTKGR